MHQRFCSISEVQKMTGYSIPSIRRKSADSKDDFPTPVRLSTRCVRWDIEELENWLLSRPKAH